MGTREQHNQMRAVADAWIDYWEPRVEPNPDYAVPDGTPTQYTENPTPLSADPIDLFAASYEIYPRRPRTPRE